MKAGINCSVCLQTAGSDLLVSIVPGLAEVICKDHSYKNLGALGGARQERREASGYLHIVSTQNVENTTTTTTLATPNTPSRFTSSHPNYHLLFKRSTFCGRSKFMGVNIFGVKFFGGQNDWEEGTNFIGVTNFKGFISSAYCS